MNKSPIIINMISGKGGTGKTVLSAVVGDSLGNQGFNVLIVDLDVFVRGLTSLLYFYKGQRITLVDNDKLAVSDYFKRNMLLDIKCELGISKYRSFSVLPAVHTIDQLLDSKDILPNDLDEAKEILKRLIAKIVIPFDIVIFDSRSGFDELIVAAHEVSDVSICVEEDDDISRITSDILLKQLEQSSNVPRFRVINKYRNIKKYLEMEKYTGITDLGKIPFDIDVMNSFSSSSFWDDISKTLYKEAVIKVWNRLCQKLDLKYELPIGRKGPFIGDIVEKKLGLFSLRHRIMFLYGIIIGLGGLFVSFLGTDFLAKIIADKTRLVALIIGFIGIILSIASALQLGKK